MKAVILAAGMGKRIRDQHVLPKGFIQLGNKSIIEESIEKLMQHGIEKILIVTGYADQHYEQLTANYPNITTIKNNFFHNTGSLYSLCCAHEWLDDDFILLESDLVYDEEALVELLNNQHKNIILVSGYTQSRDEVYVEAEANHLVNMSKNPEHLNQSHIIGEFVGINKISIDAYRQLLAMTNLDTKLLHQGEYETAGLVSLTKSVPLYCHKMNELIWCEIDDLTHLQRAQHIYARLRTVRQ